MFCIIEQVISILMQKQLADHIKNTYVLHIVEVVCWLKLMQNKLKLPGPFKTSKSG